MYDACESSPDESAGSNFIREIIAEDVRQGTHGGRVTTRFPPEPNGYLHIGHAKAIITDFALADEVGGTTNLRFDDTNPLTEDTEFVEGIQEDIRWLGFEWENLYFASDYFERMVELAEGLIREGKAYVCDLTLEEVREYRGSASEPGRPCPGRSRSVEENLDLFRRMQAGEFPDGHCTLRAKIDLENPNILMRDPLLYRIRHAHHHRTGDRWCIYPMYDWAHPLGDALEDITHSICTLEFENNRELYDWVVENTAVTTRPRQYEMARLNLTYTMMSKRKLRKLVEDGTVRGWDDPRMPTLRGFKRRGATAQAIRRFVDRVGVAKTNSVVDYAMFEHVLRDTLNPEVRRVMAVLDPLKVVVEGFEPGRVDWIEAPFHPDDPSKGARYVPFTGELYIEREDFALEPPAKWRRLAPGWEVRLRYGYVITCTEVIQDADGRVVELRCSYDPDSRGGDTADGRKVKGTLHWVSATESVPAEVRLYNPLFTREDPEGGPEGTTVFDFLNPESEVVMSGARVEPSVALDAPGSRYQFTRLGYFCVDADSRPGALVFNRTVALRDSYTKKAEPKLRLEAPPEVNAPTLVPVLRPEPRRDILVQPAAVRGAFLRYADDVGISEDDAFLLATDPALGAFFEQALAAGTKNPQGVANQLVNELQRELKAEREVPFGGAELAELVALIDEGVLSSKLAKDVFGAMLAGEGRPSAIVDARGLRQVSDAGALAVLVDQVLAANGDKVEQFRGGRAGLMGFFVGQVMRASKGKANPQLVQQLLGERLGG
ncbi:MAG: glutamine--tRNA ligase/YqeY domain fusion protein [Alphaproteobacteria bacterium]|nr:glutamine--tRNA ligase/YqeY domain fusion protein [Alphaproteobacteria bacterium]